MAFQIKPNKKETDNKTIRFPLALINKIEAVIDDKDISFSGFVIQACEYALENMETTQEENSQTDKS
ncbi:MAG: hypothetical protein E7396_09430 [Ruminococcaceae bacterium]|nr:hypothetical protein [Oscillospiraceae bacterium]